MKNSFYFSVIDLRFSISYANFGNLNFYREKIEFSNTLLLCNCAQYSLNCEPVVLSSIMVVLISVMHFFLFPFLMDYSSSCCFLVFIFSKQLMDLTILLLFILAFNLISFS